MASLNLEQVDVVLLEEKSNIRVLVKSTLRGIGFGNIFECRHVDRARSLIENNSPDLLILDLDLDYETVSRLISDVRQQRIGTNPFVIIIGLTWVPKSKLVRAALDAGTDDIVTKPISGQILIERVTYLIENRKTFIAARDYVGPLRGKGVRTDDEDVARIEVPNSLRLKATGKKSGESSDKDIARAVNIIALQRLNGLALDIAGLAGELEDRGAQSSNGLQCDDEIKEICGFVVQIEDISVQETIRSLPMLVASLVELTAIIEQSAVPAVRQFAMLRLHAEAIVAALRGDTEGSDDVAAALGEAQVFAR